MELTGSPWGSGATSAGTSAPGAEAAGATGVQPGGAVEPGSYWWPGSGPGTGPAWGAPFGPGPAPGYPPAVAEAPAARVGGTPAGPGRRGGVRAKPKSFWQRLVGSLAAAAAFVAKFGALLLKVKYLGLVLSMLVSVAAYSLLWGWTFALGFVLLMLVHELGHVIELKRQGVRASLPMFIPFLGAFVNMRDAPRSAYQEAMSGLAGPYFGTAASVVVGLWGHAIGSGFLVQLAAFGFMINLFNLLPVLPLDGGRAAAALHPVLWLLGLAGLVGLAFVAMSPVLLLVLVLGGLELWRRWTRRNSPQSLAYHALSARQRAVVASLYVAVIGVTLVGFQATYIARGL